MYEIWVVMLVIINVRFLPAAVTPECGEQRVSKVEVSSLPHYSDQCSESSTEPQLHYHSILVDSNPPIIISMWVDSTWIESG